jgi:hypothetical protein
MGMAPRALTVLVGLLVLPALAPAASAVVETCMEFPFCGYAALTQEAANVAQRAEEGAGEVVAEAVPDSSDAMLLVGQGRAFVRLASGVQGTCEGPSRMVLEASAKPFNLEPMVTMSYGGASQQGSLLAPCLMGQMRQPVKHDLQGSFDGAWTGSKSFPAYTWSLQVSAPLPDGTRSVHYQYLNVDGTRHTFDGVLAEYR